MKENLRIHWPGMLLIILAIITGLNTYQEYGVNWDDPYQRVIGQVNYDYVTKNDQALPTYMYKEYGPGYELLLVFIENKMDIKDSRDIFLMRHLVTHIFFLISACFFYLLAYRLFKSSFLACLCFLMMVFAPRIYTHSFFNTKDIPFFAATSIALYLCTVALQKRTSTLFVIAGLFCGFATSVRIMGVMLFVFIFLYLLIDIVAAIVKKEKKGTQFIHLAIFGLSYCAALYTCFPYLWAHPVTNFAHCFSAMSHYRWDGTIFQNGTVIHSDNIPWYVFFVWFLITNPIIWLVVGFAGVAYFFIDLFKAPLAFLANSHKRIFVLYFLCFATPIIAVIGLHSVIYEDWRHLFFVYPPFVLLALYFVSRLPQGKFRLAVQATVLLQVAVTGYTMFRAFPLNNVYFNPLVSHSNEHLRKHYEMDYWGVSFKQGIDHILATDQNQHIRITADRSGFTPLENNIMLLPAQDRNRLQLVGSDQPFDYYLTDFRCHPDDYDYPVKDYSVKASNSTVLGIYKMK